MPNTTALAIHGGAGIFSRDHFPLAEQARYKHALEKCLDTGWTVLQDGGSALDATQHAVAALEDCPFFNAGHGSVLNEDGHIECDAAIMAGDGRAGAVTGVNTIRNPIELARAILEDGQAVLVTCLGAERLADKFKVARVEESYFITEQRKLELVEAKEGDRVALDTVKFGTVGAVARDKEGHLAAATSTGGLSNKQLGRVGDTPLIGVGTYAKDDCCAISCTGVGEAFIRHVLAHEIAARVRYAGQSLEDAVCDVVYNELPPMGGVGGVIAVSAEGELSTHFNSRSMFRAYRRGRAKPVVSIF